VTVPPAVPSRSLAELRRERALVPAAPHAPAAAEPAAAPESPAAPTPEPEVREAPVGAVDIDDVVVAWAEILPGLPPATRAAVRDAQPLAVDDDVITFGVPRAHYESALPRFKKEADNIRAALSARLGRRMRFKTVPHDGFDSSAMGADADAVASGDPGPDDGDEIVDLDELMDARHDTAAVDSLSLLTRSFDATVVEEVPRD
jgi:hypothetical protein